MSSRRLLTFRDGEQEFERKFVILKENKPIALSSCADEGCWCETKENIETGKT